jgi:16S rRNA (guanine(527)-N(7))-methyltransferase RsmG
LTLAAEAAAARAGESAAAPALTRFLELLAEANERVNLVSRRAGAEELAGHLSDSLTALPFVPPERPLRLLDIGSGGGFPAVPILLCRKNLTALFVESVGKKAAFLTEVCRTLGLTAEVVNARFPDSLPKRMPPFDLLTSRAVADPLGLVSAARPFLAPGARALLFTTRRVLSESRARIPHRFEPIPGTDQKGLAIVEADECFT